MTVESKRILIVKLAALGDLATTSALLTRIRAERPGATVTWVVGKAGASLVRMFDGVDEVIDVDEFGLFQGGRARQLAVLAGVWKRLLGRKFDLAVIPHADPRYRLVVPMIPARRIRKFEASRPGLVNPIPGRFIGDEAARLLDPPGSPQMREAYDVADVRARARDIVLPAEVAGSRVDVVLVPGGARNVLRDSPLRRWPVERYAALAAALEDRGYRVAIVGDRNDEWVRPAFASTKVVDVVGRLDLPQTLRLLSDARVVVTHDTGPLHFARLVRARIVALFGPTAPRQMIGNPDGVTVLWGGEHLPCRPCYDGKEFPPCALNLCMSEIPMESVLAATLAWIINGTSLPTA